MASGATYTPIATFSPTSGATVTFSSIPSTYQDLILEGMTVGTAAANFTFYVNGDNSSGLYSRTTLNGDGSSATSTRGTGSNLAYGGDMTNGTPTTQIINLMNYANSSTYKTFLSRGSSAGTAVLTRALLWRNTNAITSITCGPDSGSFAAGTTLTLYGLAAA